MGCGSSNTIKTLDESKDQNKNKKNDPKSTMLNSRSFDKEEMTGNGSMEYLENWDLLIKFLNKPRVKEYIDKFISKGVLSDKKAEEFTGLFEEISEEFRELIKNRFEIEFTIPEEEFTIESEKYKLICTPSKDISKDLFLPFFFLEFCLYPRNYIKKSQVRKICFVETLQFETAKYSQYRAGCPEYNETFSLYYCTKERSLPYIRQIIHHEFFHYVDWTDDESYDDDNWRKFNPPEFKYGNGGAYERKWVPLDPECRGFINHYSTTGIEEDKAEIFQYIMSKPEEAINNPDEIIKKKVNYMMRWLCNYDPRGFGSQEKYYFANLIDFRNKHDYP